MLKLIKFLILLISFTTGNYSINIINPYAYHKNDEITVTVGTMNSIETQIPFEYFYLQICVPEKYEQQHDNLGFLSGETTYLTYYKFKIGENEYCQKVCEKQISKMDANLIEWMINRGYSTNWYLDKLPAGEKIVPDPQNSANSEILYQNGIPLGKVNYHPTAPSLYTIYNHFTFTVKIHKEGENDFSIVGFSILPFSIHQNNKTGLKCHSKDEYNKNFYTQKQDVEESEDRVYFSYDVIFELSTHTFSSRWDHYLHLENDKIHWFSLINSSLIILIFSSVILHIFCRALKKDIEIYNTRVAGEDFIDEFGWKQVCNDVFRKPAHGMFLSSLVGTGIQLFSMIVFTLLFAIIGFLTPDKRGSLLILMILLFVFMGVFAGYYSARFYKMFQGREWLKNSLLTAFLYPSLLFSILCIINLMLWFEGSSAQVKFTDMIALLLLWICCSSPLVLIGSFIGIKKKVIKNPCKVNPVPSSIPDKPWFLKLKFVIFITGVIPFCVIFIELIYIMASIWRHYFYYLFGFLFVVLLILIIVCSEISIIMSYVYLCKGDYNWWWKSFFISGSPALYVMGYSVYYFFTLNIQRVSSIFFYFGLMTILTSFIFLITATMGFILTYYFLRTIYSRIKID